MLSGDKNFLDYYRSLTSYLSSKKRIGKTYFSYKVGIKIGIKIIIRRIFNVLIILDNKKPRQLLINGVQSY